MKLRVRVKCSGDTRNLFYFCTESKVPIFITKTQTREQDIIKKKIPIMVHGTPSHYLCIKTIYQYLK